MAIYGRLDLQNALVTASKSMIRVKDPTSLLKLITRFIDRQIGATHVAILLFDRDTHSFILIDSKGEAGQKIPVGYIRVTMDSPIISYFRGGKQGTRRGKFHRKEAVVYDEIDSLRNFEIHVNRKEESAIHITQMKEEMDDLRASICVPSYFKNELVAVLLLGDKLSGEKYINDEIAVFSTLANDVAMAVTNAELIKDLKFALEREHDLLMDTSSALASAIDARDKYTKGHSERVSHYTLVLATELIENGTIPYSRDFLETAQLTGLLHDVGKIGIRDEILNKPAALSDEEYSVMKNHVQIGVKILKPIKGLEAIADGCKYHHERWDGKGYPYGLKGQEIPILGRIVCIVDSYDTMVTSRPYQKGRSPEEAFAELRRCAGYQFDANLVEVFHTAWREGRIHKQRYKKMNFTRRR